MPHAFPDSPPGPESGLTTHLPGCHTGCLVSCTNPSSGSLSLSLFSRASLAGAVGDQPPGIMLPPINAAGATKPAAGVLFHIYARLQLTWEIWGWTNGHLFEISDQASTCLSCSWGSDWRKWWRGTESREWLKYWARGIPHDGASGWRSSECTVDAGHCWSKLAWCRYNY